MTRQQALNAALETISNYYTSRSHDEHLAKQRQEVRDGCEEVKKNQLKQIGKLVLKFIIGILAVWTALYLLGM